ncbi:ligase-associated DNA damage response endonuclease PdeM [Novosphingobium sp. FSY-8]|uniref:Ligase-associated DNA damage response endonuclease PdeM n=1 Tax=Novosphingobium ovatum TaxID=1908523 RepID=A0ABW9X9H1_9SPHN|nr:ligase-associated DNA damage response endonuclease PdeM [Novosphingobium ovatum]NBC35183.1 ligase-associated DNA damage response endonuclease PdeM [Novosphingobium ovatum]
MAHTVFAPFVFADRTFAIAESRAVWWADQRALLVADLHLEKASWFAARGQMLPPYDSRATLERLSAAVAATGARTVYCLGDNFHDSDGPERMEPVARALLAELARQVAWVWITGNHDPDVGNLPGDVVDETLVDGIALRHQAAVGVPPCPEISGHYHPRLRLRVQGRMIARPCALIGDSRMVLPAFGALTGGMDAADPALTAAMAPARRIQAIVPAQGRALRFPVTDGANPASACG